MSSVTTCALPPHALLTRYAQQGAYTDCYTTLIPSAVSHAEYVQAFYTTPLFKTERLILKLLASKPSTDTEAKLLSEGTIDHFAAWSVEARTDNQLLMCDFQSRTRSWLMTEPALTTGQQHTRLYFGSAVVPKRDTKSGMSSMGGGFNALLSVHKLYSVALLRSAVSKLNHRALA
jgi:hypothetical protein